MVVFLNNDGCDISVWHTPKKRKQATEFYLNRNKLLGKKQWPNK